LNSRSGWGDDAVSVSFVCTNRIQGHQAQDQNAFLIYKDGFRATHGNLHSLWGIYQATDAFNTILVGGTGQAYGGDWDTPTETVHDIGIMPRCELASDYVYAVGDASDAYYTNAGQFGHGEDRLLEVFTRELVHLVPDLVVVYDRVIPVDPADTPTWMLHTAEQPVLSGTQLQASDGAQRLENWSLLPAGGVIDTAIHPGGSTYGSPDTLTSWRTTIEPPQSEKENYFLNVLRVSDQGSSDVVTVSPVGSLFEDLVGARIATAEKAWVILFTTGADAVAPVSVARYTDSSDRRDDHVVFGMTPGASYDIQVKKEKDGLAYRVTIVPGTAVTASLQGTLRFTMDAFLPGDTDVTPEDPPASRTYRFALRANHPNPFNPSTTIAFELPEASPVELSVFDARGAHVVTLVEGVRAAGPHEISWNGHNTEGRAVGSGVYFYRLRAGSRSATRKMVLLK
jgi:hypothetical protein